MHLSYSYNSSQLQIGVLSPCPLQIPLTRALRAAQICLRVLWDAEWSGGVSRQEDVGRL